MKDKINYWKPLAIIFIILFIFETGFLIWLFEEGAEMYEKELECVYNICEDYDSYLYDEYAEVCYCFEDDEIAKTKFMK